MFADCLHLCNHTFISSYAAGTGFLRSINYPKTECRKIKATPTLSAACAKTFFCVENYCLFKGQLSTESFNLTAANFRMKNRKSLNTQFTTSLL